jgi:hypothetical protein
MRYKSEYIKRKKINGLFLEMRVEPNWADDYGQIVPFEFIGYKIVYKNEKNERIRIEIGLYDTLNYYLKISSPTCRRYIENEDEGAEGIYSENIREFWRYLRNFEEDLKMRIMDILSDHGSEINQECRNIIDEVLDKL